MYMRRLVELAEQISDQFPTTGYKKKKYQWIAVVQDNQTIHFIRADKNDQRTLPDLSRAGTKPKPILLTDNAEYVFGLEAPGNNIKNKNRASERNEAYLNLLEECLLETGCDSIRIIKDAIVNRNWVIPNDMKQGDFIVFRQGMDYFPHEEQQIKDFWMEKVTPKGEKLQNKMCIVCGRMAPAVERHSIKFGIGKETTKLISANEDAYLSYGLEASEVAPTCFSCEQKYGKTLTYLLQKYSDPNLKGGPHAFAAGGVTYVYWMKKSNNEMSIIMSWLNQPDPESVRRVLMSPFTGIQSDASDFYLLALTANKARLVVRDYTEKPFWKVKEQLKQFFAGQEVGAPKLYGIYALASSMYKDASKEMQKYAIQEWVNWALNGTKLSGRIASHILKRIQAGGEMNVLHASAIKSWLISQKKEEWTVDLDGTNEKVSYLCGRLFAVLEKIQEEAIRGNETIAARFFGSASTTPKSVFGLLIRNSQAHINKLQKEKPGLAVNYSKELQNILEKVTDFPSVLDLHKQAEFALGYYHQKQNFYKPKQKENKGDKVL